MDYPLSEGNWICRWFGHSFGRPYRDRRYVPCDPPGSVRWDGDYKGPTRRTCSLCGLTDPPRPLEPWETDPRPSRQNASG